MARCIENRCRKKRAPGKRRCYACCKRRYNEANPIRQCCHNKKGNAKRDGHVFELTFEQFKAFAIKVDLVRKRGRTKDSYTIDRVDNTKGYTVDNIARLDYSSNSRKGKRKITYDHTTGIGNIVDWSIPEKQESDPF